MKYFLIIFVLLCSCRSPRNQENSRQKSPAGDGYAHGFSVTAKEGEYLLTVRNPWEKARNVELTYLLKERKNKGTERDSGANVIYYPVRRVICLSTSHLAFLNLLGESGKVTGVSGAPYISDKLIIKGISDGKIRDVGYGSNLNYEEIIRQRPDVVFAYGVDGEISGFLGKFRDLGIPVVMVAEYLESNPLGKTEWIKFMAPFFGKVSQADSLFREIEKRYLRLAEQTAHLSDRPHVMVGLPYRDNWWVPGADSYLARLIADAGGHYLAGKAGNHESYVISMEDAIHIFSGANFWINTGMVSRKEEILSADPRFGKLPFFSTALIFNNNKRCTPAGGIDFWESGTVCPDVVLSDLIRIFHPELKRSDSLVYYREVR